MFLLCNKSFAQIPGLLEFSGKTIKKGQPLSGAVVTVYRNNTVQQEQIRTGKNGKFRFYLVFGQEYKITFSASGCVYMFLIVDATTLKKERRELFPVYEIEIPFFELSEPGVNILKYRKPITKVIYDGKYSFIDDENYLKEFTKDLIVDPKDQAKMLAEREEKERADREKLIEEIAAKNEAAEKVRINEERKLAEKKKAMLDELERALALERLKEELSNEIPITYESMETEAIRLQKETEAKKKLAERNKEIKTNYNNDILKLVAENERIEKLRTLSYKKNIAKSNTAINQIRKETELKAKANELMNEQKRKEKLEIENKQVKGVEMKRLVEAAAFAEKAIKISNQNLLPDVRRYQKNKIPTVLVYIDEGFFKTTRVTTIIKGKTMNVYKKVYYLWSNTYYYKNEKVIDESTYNVEIAFYSSYK